MPKRKIIKVPRKRIKLPVDLKVLQLIIVAVIFAFAFTILSFLAQVLTPDPNKAVTSLPDIVLTQADLLINTAGWKTYNANGIKFKYPNKWILVEKAAILGPKAGSHTFFTVANGASRGVGLFVIPETLPGEWIGKVYSPGFLKQAESVSLVKIDGRNATKVINLPQVEKNEFVFIAKNNMTYILYAKGLDKEIRILENLLKTVKLP